MTRIIWDGIREKVRNEMRRHFWQVTAAWHLCCSDHTRLLFLIRQRILLLEYMSGTRNWMQREGKGSIYSETYSHVNNEQDQYLCSDHDPLDVCSSEGCSCVHGKVGSLVSLRLFDFCDILFSASRIFCSRVPPKSDCRIESNCVCW